MFNRRLIAAIGLTSVLAGGALSAQNPVGLAEPGDPTSAKPGILSKIAIDQRIGHTLPLDAAFVDDHGRNVRLGDYFGRRPVVLALVYYECPMLCTQVLNGLVSSLGTLNLTVGKEFDVVAISFNPKEGPGLASQKKANYVERYGRPESADGWHFLTGEQGSIDRLSRAAGFRFAWDEATQQFAHPAGVVVLTPDGRLARYVFGIEYGGRDLRFAIVEASNGRLGSIVDTILLYCYHYDPMTGRYGLVVMRAIRLAGAATILALGTFIFVMVRRERVGADPRVRPGPTHGSAPTAES